MADYLSTISGPRGTLKFVETAGTATLGVDVLVGGSLVYAVKIDATANTGEAVYLKLWFVDHAASAITVGTTAPNLVLRCPAGETVEYYIPLGISDSAQTELNGAVVREAGTAGATAPSGTVSYTIIGA
tara:strand:- start:89 stop:475 length:387 start_codon:yes stop_codon:yes gene_type:complete